MSGIDAADGFSTGTRVPRRWELLKLSESEEPNANGRYAMDQTINALRAHLAELDITAAQGREGLKELLAIIADEGDERLPVSARINLVVLAALPQALQTRIGSVEKRVPPSVPIENARDTHQRIKLARWIETARGAIENF